MKTRLAILTSHPIHYQAPLWKLLTMEDSLDVEVLFQRDAGIRDHYDKEFNRVIHWNLPLLEGYKHIFISGFKDLCLRLKQRRYDAIIVHAWNSPMTWMVLVVAKIFGVKTLLRAENPWKHEAKKSFAKKMARGIILRIFFAMIDAFLFIGLENKKLYLKYGVSEEKLFSAPYAVENERFFAAAARLRAERSEIRTELGLSSDAIVFLSVGKLIEKKRHLDILRAYEHCEVPDKSLVIVGEGVLRPILEEYINDHHLRNVSLPGFVDQVRLPYYYAAADVFIMPSGNGETWGLVVNEAMCFGLPVIASDMVGAAHDLILPGESGFVFELGDIKRLREIMEQLGNDRGQRETLGAGAREAIKKNSYEENVQGVLKALEFLKNK